MAQTCSGPLFTTSEQVEQKIFSLFPPLYFTPSFHSQPFHLSLLLLYFHFPLFSIVSAEFYGGLRATIPSFRFSLFLSPDMTRRRTKTGHVRGFDYLVLSLLARSHRTQDLDIERTGGHAFIRARYGVRKVTRRK